MNARALRDVGTGDAPVWSEAMVWWPVCTSTDVSTSAMESW